MQLDSSGYVAFEHDPASEVVARYKGFCAKCLHTFWQNEIVVREKRGFLIHRDCLVALADSTPRRLNPKWEHALPVDKAKIKKKAKQMIRKNRD